MPQINAAARCVRSAGPSTQQAAKHSSARVQCRMCAVWCAVWCALRCALVARVKTGGLGLVGS
eukprot:2911557-Prymnesium_polylepis.1